MACENWRIVVLEHDDASEQIGDLFSELFPDITEVREINDTWAQTKTQARKVGKSVKVGKEQKVLTLYGYGGNHHITYGLCREVADERSENYAYIHFDHHMDYGHSDGSYDEHLNCGSFVRAILHESKAQALRYVGCGTKYFPDLEEIRKTYGYVHESRLRDDGVKKSIEQLIQNTPDDVYISMDLDVLANSEMKTGFDRGDLRLGELLEALNTIGNDKNIISADVLGYYTGFPRGVSDKASLLAYVEIAEKITGRELDPAVKEEAIEKIKNSYCIGHTDQSGRKGVDKDIKRPSRHMSYRDKNNMSKVSKKLYKILERVYRYMC